MAAQSAQSVRFAWKGHVACGWIAAGVILAAPCLTRGQPPGVEQWRGNQRVTPEAPAAAPAAPVSTQPVLLRPVPRVEERPAVLTGEVLPPLRVTDLPPLRFQPEPPPIASGRPVASAAKAGTWHRQLLHAGHQVLQGCENTVQACASSVGTSTGQVVDALAVVTESPVGRATDAAARATPATDAPPALAPAVTAPAAPSAAGDGMLWVQLALLTAVVTGPLAVIAGLALMVRWSGMKFRVEIVNTGGTAMPDLALLRAALAPPPAAATDSTAVDALAAMPFDVSPAGDVPPQEDPFTGEFFDLGPSYEEEQQMKQDALRAREQAVLQQVFEENLKLRQELDELGPDDGDAGLPE